MNELERLLKEHPFLDDLPEKQLSKIIPCASLVHFAPSETLCKEGERAHGSFLILSGRVALEIQRTGRASTSVQTVPRGDAIGWSWLLSPHRWHFDAIALEETNAIFLDGAKLRAACDADHDLGYELARRYLTLAHERVEALRLQVADVHARARSL